MAFDFNANEVFQMAIEIEENGRLFYLKARELVDDPDVKNLFSDLCFPHIQRKYNLKP